MTTHISRQTHCLRLNSNQKMHDENSRDENPQITSTTKTTNSKFGLRARTANARNGLTLIEIMIALTMTLIVLGAMAQAFKFASGEIAQGRAILEMSNRLRNAEQLLRTDLAGLTVDVRPHTSTEPNGYFEYIDGPNIDSTAIGSENAYLGDIDDVLAFTSRNLEGNFRGRFNNGTIQGSFAEVIWFTELNDLNNNNVVDFNESLVVYRRVLLLRPDLNDSGGGGPYDLPYTTGDEDDPNNMFEALEFFAENDISARWIDTDDNDLRDTIVANSLADLGKRENRFCRDSRAISFPHELIRSVDCPQPVTAATSNQTNDLNCTKMGAVIVDSNNNRRIEFTGDDILLTDVAAFDVKVYSPDLKVELIDIDGNNSAETLVMPSDVGYTGFDINGNELPRIGGFVDLASNSGTALAYDPDNPVEPRFTTLPTDKSQLDSIANPVFGLDVSYCTWSPHYESDGIDQDGVFAEDQGTNGLDDDDANGVDDEDEKETSPPYPYPVRGIKVTFRIIEKKTKQLRQTSIIQNFLPQ